MSRIQMSSRGPQKPLAVTEEETMKFCATFILLTAFSLCGCLGPKIVRMDGDTDLVQKRSAQMALGPPIGAKAAVYKAANKFAAKQGMLVETVEFKMVNTGLARAGSVELQFRGVPPK